MIPNLLCCLILRQLHTYEMLNKIVDPSNKLCIVCFPCIYQSSIPLFNILGYHISSTNISPHLFTLKEISNYITPVQIIISIQPHTHRLKWIIFFSSHNNNNKKKKIKTQKQRRTKYQIAKIEQISSRSYTITPKHKNIAEPERKYQIAEIEGKIKYQNNCRNKM